MGALLTMAEMFMDRVDAGRQLAQRLAELEHADTVILGIAYGGIPIAYEVAKILELPMDVIIPRKLPIPWNPEAGFGAVASGGVIVLNDALVKELGLTRDQIEKSVSTALQDIKRREQLFRSRLPQVDIKERLVIIVDDGIASGYTMLAAVQSAREAGARRVVAAAPVASESAVRLIKGSVEEMVCLVESHRLPFAVADYYVVWHDLNDEEVLQYLPERPKTNGPPQIGDEEG